MTDKHIWYIFLFAFLLILLLFTMRGNMTVYESFQTQHILDKIYGKSCPRNPYTSTFDKLLTKWDQIAKKANIPYSITYGTYLGWLRHGDYIPYDDDMDVHIGQESVSKLMAMKGKEDCCESRELGEKPLQTDVPRLILNPYHEHRVHDQHRPRYGCDGQTVQNYKDNCSFNGPIARIIYPGKEKFLHIDIFVFHREDDKDKRTELETQGWATKLNGPYGVYVASSEGSRLPPVKPCVLHGIGTSCFVDGTHFLKSNYGRDYMKPDKVWNTSDQKWASK